MKIILICLNNFGKSVFSGNPLFREIRRVKSFGKSFNLCKDNELTVTYELLILIKTMIQNPTNENVGHEFDIKDFGEIKWHKAAIKTLQEYIQQYEWSNIILEGTFQFKKVMKLLEIL